MTAIEGMGAVRARIGEIEARFGARSPAGFRNALASASAPTGTASEVAAPGSPTPGAPPAAVADDARVDVATLRSLAAPLGARSASASVGPDPTGDVDGDWAGRLPVRGRRWAPEVARAASAAGVDPALLAALVTHESGFDPDARSHAGAIGLTQLMPGTARELGVDPHDPVANLAGGARYLRAQLDRFGTPELALAAYNAGPRRVADAGGVPAIAETRAYVDRVLTTYDRLR